MSKFRYLSAEYLEQLEQRGHRMPEKPGLDLEIQHVIRETPEGGDIEYYFRIRDGRLAEARRGTLECRRSSPTSSGRSPARSTR